MQSSRAIRWCEEILMNNFLKKTNEFLAQSIRSRAILMPFTVKGSRVAYEQKKRQAAAKRQVIYILLKVWKNLLINIPCIVKQRH